MASESERVRRHIERMYDLQPQREWQRMDRHRTEFAITLRALREYLPPPPARILDCGAGPGRYAIELAAWGYEVVLFDLSSGCLDMAREKAAEAGVTLAGYEQGTATDLSRFPQASFDAVLLMGPLYHLLEDSEREEALEEARRVLRPGGPLFAAFITRYAVPRYAAANDPDWLWTYPDQLEQIMAEGVCPPRGISETEFVAYFAHPEEVGPWFWATGLEVRTILGVEGLVSMHEEGVNALEGEEWAAWLDLNWRVAADPTILGCTEHLLVVAVRPRWCTVLAQMARRLDGAGVPYKIVGGTAAALHGVPVPVRDIDLETDVAGAHRIEELFAGAVVEPLALREGETYRSYLGRLALEGVPVEIMGDLHRREGETWVPTMAATETRLEVEGVPVRVPWLEEETLAYLRRGRLDRAALCLPYCDPDRLGMLLRGGRPVGVL